MSKDNTKVDKMLEDIRAANKEKRNRCDADRSNEELMEEYQQVVKHINAYKQNRFGGTRSFLTKSHIKSLVNREKVLSELLDT